MKKSEPIDVLTVGFQEIENPPENFSFPRFVKLLQKWRVNRLVDIRRHNNTNVYPTNPWCKTNLALALKKKGTQYTEFRAVAPSAKLLLKEKYGIPTEPCNCRSVKTCWKQRIHARRQFTLEEFQEEYLEELRESGGVKALRDMLFDHADERLVLMCWEADPNKCHRRMLVDALLKKYRDEFETDDINECERHEGQAVLTLLEIAGERHEERKNIADE